MLDVAGTAGIDDELSLNGGVTGAAPAYQIDMGAYFDNAGNPSLSHISLYNGLYGFGISSGTLNIISGEDFAFYDSGDYATRLLTIDSSAGSVSIGNDSTPDYRLEVVSTAGSGYFGVTNTIDGDVFKIDAAGQVGINIADPEVYLHVAGGTTGSYFTTTDWLASGTTGSGIHIATGAATGDSTYGVLQVYNSGSLLAGDLVINGAGGEVGIGDTTPTSVLDIDGATNPQITIEESTTEFLRLGVEETTGRAAAIGWDDGDSLVFGVYSSASQVADSSIVEFARITDGGVFGVGTSSPQGQGIHVTAGWSGALPNAQTELVVEDNTTAAISILTPNTVTGNIYFGDPESSTVGRVRYDHSLNTLELWTNSTQQLTVDSSGNVGIGTTTALSLLHIQSATDPTFTISNSDTTLAAAQSLGSIDFISWDATSIATPIRASIVAVGNTSTGASGGVDLAFSTGNTGAIVEAMRIFATGVVAIGSGTITASTTGDLYVQDDIEIDGIDSGGTGTFVCITSGNILMKDPTCQSASSLRFKHNVESLEENNGLAYIHKLRPVSFEYNNATGTVQYGFIAEEVEALDTTMVRYDENGDLFGIPYQNFIPMLTRSIQELDFKVEALASSTPSTENEGFVDGFFANVFARVGEWLANADNGIAKLFAKEIYAENIYADKVTTKELCIEDVCVTKQQLLSLLNGQSVSSGGGGSSAPSSGGTGGADEGAPDTEAPVITINGNNPATVQVGATYADLGASVFDAVSTNIGIHTFVDGVEVQTVQLDTSVAGEHAIEYRATDEAGNTGTATRTVIVEAAGAGAPETEGSTAAETATTTPATTEPVTPAPEVSSETASSTPSN